MIDVSKVRMMTKLAVYEKEKAKKELKMHRYSMRSYLSLKLLGSFFAVTVAYGLGASLYMMRYYSNIMTEGLAFSSMIFSESCWSYMELSWPLI